MGEAKTDTSDLVKTMFGNMVSPNARLRVDPDGEIFQKLDNTGFLRCHGAEHKFKEYLCLAFSQTSAPLNRRELGILQHIICDEYADHHEPNPGEPLTASAFATFIEELLTPQKNIILHRIKAKEKEMIEIADADEQADGRSALIKNVIKKQP